MQVKKLSGSKTKKTAKELELGELGKKRDQAPKVFIHCLCNKSKLHQKLLLLNLHI